MSTACAVCHLTILSLTTMFRLDHDLLLSVARRLDVSRDLQSLSETSKVLHALASQGVLPGPVELRGPGDVCSVDQLQQILSRAKQMHRVPVLTIIGVPYLPHDFFGLALAMRSLTLTKCTLEHLPQLPAQLTSLVITDTTLRKIAPGTLVNLTGLVELKLASLTGLQELPALAPNLSEIELSILKDLTSPLPLLPYRLETLAFYDPPLEFPVPREIPPSLASLTWQIEGIDLTPSLQPFSHLTSLRLDALVWGSVDGIEDLSPLHSNLKSFTLTGDLDCPESISTLTNLTSLDITLSSACAFPPVLHHLQQLEGLALRPAPPLDSLGDLVRLSYLKLQYENFEVVPATISRLTALRDLSISWQAFDTLVDAEEAAAAAAAAAAAGTNPIPATLQYLTNLDSLELVFREGNPCWTIPSLTSSLTQLVVSNCRLPTERPSCKLRQLSWSALERYEDSAFEFTRCVEYFKATLRDLNVCSVPFSTLPAAIFDFRRLSSLRLAACDSLTHVFAKCIGDGHTTNSSSSSRRARRYILPHLESLAVVHCESFVAVAETAELAAEILPNLQELSIQWCPTRDVGQLEQLGHLLPQLEIEEQFDAN